MQDRKEVQRHCEFKMPVGRFTACCTCRLRTSVTENRSDLIDALPAAGAQFVVCSLRITVWQQIVMTVSYVECDRMARKIGRRPALDLEKKSDLWVTSSEKATLFKSDFLEHPKRLRTKRILNALFFNEECTSFGLISLIVSNQ